MACVSGLTNGVYSFIDCCGVTRFGASVGESICLDETYTGTSVGVYIATGQTCTQNCNQGPLGYSFTVSGVCSGLTGSVIFAPFGGTPPYTIDNITPGGISAQTSYGQITFTGLTGGTYVFRLNDTLGLQNNELYINVAVTPCFQANIINASGTTCGDTNGFLQVTGTTTGSPYTILFYKDNVLQSVETTNTLPYDFDSLSVGIYYATIIDNGGATANTENAVISASTSVDFGFWKVDTSNCTTNWGKLAVTGITGTGPYTYLWSNGETTQLITGLTQGIYSCTVTDSLGCQTTKSETVGVAQPLGLSFLTANQPTCFSSDGSLTFTISGGSQPLYFSATSSQVGFTLSDTFTLTGLSSGNYNVLVRDANFCEIVVNGYLLPPNGFSVVGTTVTNSTCNITNGSIDVNIAGANAFYTYSLSGLSTNTIQTNVSQNQNFLFSNLANDTYQLTISGSGTQCVYTELITISSTEKFQVNVSTTGSTCGQLDGNASVELSTGYTLPLNYVLSNGDTILNTTLTSTTFNNLTAGSYTITVTDNDGCSVSTGFTINTGGSLITSVDVTNCTGSNDGSASVIIYDGEPPFNYLWSNGQTGSSISNLSAGNYNVTITDASGCTDTQYFTLNCTGNLISNYQTFNLCTNTFTTTTGNQRGMLEMLNEGYLDITSGYTNCTFNSAIFTCEIIINGSAFTETFYTATTLNDVPQDTLWQSTIESILSGISEVQSYQIDLLNNTLTITSNCNGDVDPLADADFTLGLEIVYDVTCSGYLFPTPTPTPTPTATPTPTSTPTPTPTPTATPTPTPTLAPLNAGSYLLYTADGAPSPLPSVPTGGSFFQTIPGRGIGCLSASTYNPDFFGIDPICGAQTMEFKFNRYDSLGNDNDIIFSNINTSGGYIKVEQGGFSAIYSGTSSDFSYGGANLDFQANSQTQQIYSANTTFTSASTFNLFIS